jgi:hypothetical protein
MLASVTNIPQDRVGATMIRLTSLLQDGELIEKKGSIQQDNLRVSLKAPSSSLSDATSFGIPSHLSSNGSWSHQSRRRFPVVAITKPSRLCLSLQSEYTFACAPFTKEEHAHLLRSCIRTENPSRHQKRKLLLCI